MDYVTPPPPGLHFESGLENGLNVSAEGGNQGTITGQPHESGQGLQQGLQQGTRLLVRNMLAAGLSPTEVAKIAGLTEEVVRTMGG